MCPCNYLPPPPAASFRDGALKCSLRIECHDVYQKREGTSCAPMEVGKPQTMIGDTVPHDVVPWLTRCEALWLDLDSFKVFSASKLLQLVDDRAALAQT